MEEQSKTFEGMVSFQLLIGRLQTDMDEIEEYAPRMFQLLIGRLQTWRSVLQ